LSTLPGGEQVTKPDDKNHCIACERGIPFAPAKVPVTVKVDGKESTVWISQKSYDKMIAEMGNYSNDK
jgi:uncharacterized protein YabE (DUF348 family)